MRKPLDKKRQPVVKKETFHRLFEHMAEGVAYCQMLFEGGRGSDWIYLSVNGAFENLTGLKGVVGKRVTEVIPGIRETDPDLLESYARVSQTGKPEKFEMFVGALQEWFSISAYSPQTGFFVSIFENITGRKRADAAFQEKELLLSESQRIANIGGWSWAFTGPIQWTDETYRLYGVSPETFTPTIEALVNLVHPEDRPLLQEWVRACSAGEKPAELEFRCVWPDGTVRFLNGRGERMYDAGNRPTHIFGTVQDITERKRVEIELQVREEKYIRLFESMMDGFVSVAMDGKLLECNEVYRTMLGYSKTELTQLSYTDITPEKWHALEVGIVKDQILKRGYSDVYEKEYRHKNGKVFPVELRSVLIRDEQGIPAGIWAIVRDISERKRAEEELHKKSAEIERFTNMVSHDLKSPLVTIKTFLGFLEEDLGPGKTGPVAKDLGFIGSAAEKMERLLNELLEFVRIGHSPNAPASVPLQEIVKEALELLAGQIVKRGVRVDVTREPLWLHGDRARMVEVFQNLVDNAVKYMGDQPDPRIEIGAEQGSGEIVFFVRDNGKGIDPRHISRIFGIFEKLDTDTPGVGIGLAMVKRIVEVHGGRIRVHSDGPGKGTTFRFTLAETEMRQPP